MKVYKKRAIKHCIVNLVAMQTVKSRLYPRYKICKHDKLLQGINIYRNSINKHHTVTLLYYSSRCWFSFNFTVLRLTEYKVYKRLFTLMV